MIKFSEIKMGDYLMCDFEGKQWEGEVTNLNGDEKQVLPCNRCAGLLV